MRLQWKSLRHEYTQSDSCQDTSPHSHSSWRPTVPYTCLQELGHRKPSSFLHPDSAALIAGRNSHWWVLYSRWGMLLAHLPPVFKCFQQCQSWITADKGLSFLGISSEMPQYPPTSLRSLWPRGALSLRTANLVLKWTSRQPSNDTEDKNIQCLWSSVYQGFALESLTYSHSSLVFHAVTYPSMIQLQCCFAPWDKQDEMGSS